MTPARTPIKVSVVLPVRDGESHVGGAAASILRQSFQDWELIVVDDGSTDGTLRVLEAIQDPRLRVLRQERSGLTAALNRGLASARGEFVARQDADDVSLPDRIATQVRFLDSHPEVALVGSGVTAVTASGAVLRSYPAPEDHQSIEAGLAALLAPLPHTTHLYRRSIVQALGGYRTSFARAQDYDLLLRLSERSGLAGIRRPLCLLTQTMDSATFSDGQGEQFRCAVLAMASAILRRETGVDPIAGAEREGFVAAFDSWYPRSGYPARFASRRLRRQARLSWRERRMVHAALSLAAATFHEPGWVPAALGMDRGAGIAAQVSAWARGTLRGVETAG